MTWLQPLLGLGEFADFTVRVARSLLVVPFRRPGELVRQFERVLWGGLPLALAAGFSIGLVTWLQTRRLLVDYGLESTLPSVLAVAVLVETGPMLASLLVAGRMGAGLAAELGSKTLTEEIDASEVLGAPTIATLVAPRVLACGLAVPLLTILLDTAALAGGLLAESAGGSLTAEAFGRRSLDYLRLVDIVPSTLKTGLFGLIVGLVSCFVGLNADRSTEAIGHAATRGVVLAMLGVFVANVAVVPAVQGIIGALGWNF